MYVIGELRDSSVAQKIARTFTERKVAGEVVNHGDVFVVVAQNEAAIPEVETIYRLSVGLPIRHEIPKELEKIARTPLGQLSRFIIMTSIALYLFGALGGGRLDDKFAPFFIDDGKGVLFGNILNGEVWRIWTPMFLHFNIFHIFFNLMWIKDIGSALEAQESTKDMVILTVLFGMFTNIAQYLVVGPSFGGMSGVVFAYLGHLWMRVRFNPESPYSLPKRDIILMICWLVFCMTGIVGSIANVAHAVGLSLGMISGMIYGLRSLRVEERKNNNVAVTQIILFTVLATAFSLLSIVVDWYHNGQKFYFDKFI